MSPLTQSLQHAVAQAAALPAREQDVLAAVILGEIAGEKRWDELLADSRSAAALERLSKVALAEDDAGLTETLESLLSGDVRGVTSSPTQ